MGLIIQIQGEVMPTEIAAFRDQRLGRPMRSTLSFDDPPGGGEKGLADSKLAVSAPCDGLIDLLDRHAKHPGPEAAAYIADVEANSPARRVRRSQFNGAVRLAMEKMGFVQEGESLGIEYPLLAEAAHDRRIAKVYAQPPALCLDYINAKGQRVLTKTHVDMFVLFTDGRAILVEGKLWEVAEAGRLEGNPRYSRAPASDRFVDIPVSEMAARLGLPHLVYTERDVNYTLFGNLLFLGRGYLHKWTRGPTTDQLLEHIRHIGVTTIDALLNSAEWTSDDVYGCIAKDLLHVDLKSVCLGGLAQVNVYASKAVAMLLAVPPGTASALQVPAPVHQPASLPDLRGYSPKALAIAWYRFAVIKPVVVGLMRPGDLTPLARSWWRAFKRAAAEWGAGILGLIPNFHLRGHHGSRLCLTGEKLLRSAVERTADPNADAKDKGYGVYRKTCTNVRPVSRKTFYARLAAEKLQLKTIAAERGERAAYQATPAMPLSIGAVSRTPRRAWQLGIMDHTPLPIRCVLTISGQRIDISPYLTYMRDAATRRALGTYLAWHRPRKESVIATLWDCVKRNKRLPDSIMLDGERGHDSVAVEQLLARQQVDKICRRYLRPRDGSDIERAFSYLERALLMFVRGNYVANQNPKDWPGNWNPSDFAERTIGSLSMMICKFLFGHYNKCVRPKKLGGLTPDEADALSSRVHGERGFMVHPNLDQSRILLLPSVSRGGLRMLDRQHGLRLFGQDYLPPCPLDPSLYAKEYAVLSDPTDVRYVLVHIAGQWMEFPNRNREQYEGLDPEMLSGISVEIVQTSRWHERQAVERSEQHADALDKILSLPEDPLQALHDSINAAAQPAKPSASSNWSDIDDSDICTLPTVVEVAA